MAMTPHTTASHRPVSPRIAELPSLRYGAIGATCTRSGPLKVGGVASSAQRYASTESTSGLLSRYRRSVTTPDVVGIGETTRGTSRHVRFDIPGASTPTGPSRKDGDADTTSLRTSSSAGSISRHATSTPKRYTAQRHHTTGKYVKGTLTPTASGGVAAAPAGGAIAGTPRPPPSERGAASKQTGYRSLVSRFSVTPAHKKYQHGDLLRAARETDETAVREILKRATVVGVPETELNAVDSTGRTPVSYIVSNGSVDILDAILQVPGVDVNRPDNEGNTPLHFAAQAGHVECLNYLLSRCQGVEIDARNDLGFTPLMKAALQGRNKCAKLLLFAGASPTARDSGRGLRPDQWARYCGRYVCADVIEKFARGRSVHGALPSAERADRERAAGAAVARGSGAKWGSDTDLASKLNAAAVTRSHSTAGGIKSKFRWIFRTTPSASGGGSYGGGGGGAAGTSGCSGSVASSIYADGTASSSSPRLATHLTAAAICASSPLLPAGATPSGQSVKSLVRPLSVPKLHVTLAHPTTSVDNYIPNNIPTGAYYDETASTAAAKKGGLFYKRKK